MKLCLATYSLSKLIKVGKMDIYDVLEFARDEHFEAIEFAFFINYGKHSIKKIKEKADELGIPIAITAGVFDLSNEKTRHENIEKAKQMVRDSALLGARIVLIVPFDISQGSVHYDKISGTEQIIKGLNELVPYASDMGIQITVEDFPNYVYPLCSIKDIEYILKNVPGLGWTFDNGNIIPSGDDTIEAYRKLKPYITNAHIKEWQYSQGDYGVKCYDGKYLLPGKHGSGIIDHKAIFRQLYEDDYQGYISLEYEGSLESIDTIRECKKYIMDTLDSCRQIHI